MKKEIIQRILLILVMAAVLAYTAYNYTIGNTELLYFLVATAVLLFPLISNINRLISDLKNS